MVLFKELKLNNLHSLNYSKFTIYLLNNFKN
jgi:hypothetical protein